jgi:uncharacterized protein
VPTDDEADALLEAKRLQRSGELDPDTSPVGRRTTLLSPFDRLIYDRERTERLFGFRYRMEIYVPHAERWGYFVMPVLRGDRLVGRVDPAFDRRTRVLTVNRVGWEDGPVDIELPLRSLAGFLGAEEVAWR